MLHKSDSYQVDDETFSNRDEDLLDTMELNYTLLSHFSYYCTHSVPDFISETLQSSVVANHIIEKLVTQCSRKLYDKYIGTKMANHVLISSKEYLDMLDGMEFQGHDDCDLGEETLEEDKEPVK